MPETVNGSPGTTACMAWMLDHARGDDGPSGRLLAMLAHLSALRAARRQAGRSWRPSSPKISGRVEQTRREMLAVGGPTGRISAPARG